VKTSRTVHTPRARVIRAASLLVAAGLVLGWPLWAMVTWTRYGHVAGELDRDAMLVLFLPTYEVAEHHQITVAAPASLTYGSAMDMSLNQSPLIRAIFRGREIVMRVRTRAPFPPGGVVDQMRTMGWGVLAERPEREIVLGAITQPWRGNVVFRPLPPKEFAAFNQPGYVKILVSIAADPVSDSTSRFRIETWVVTTDPTSRAKFRRYWSVFSPGIVLIRRVAVTLVKKESERRYRVSRQEAGGATKQRDGISSADQAARYSSPGKMVLGARPRDGPAYDGA
jgi:hypothetical protein